MITYLYLIDCVGDYPLRGVGVVGVWGGGLQGQDKVLNVVVVCGSLHLCGQVLAACTPFDLLETLRWERRGGEGGTFVLLQRHMQRLARALVHFGFSPEPHAADILVGRVRERLRAMAAEEWAHETSLVRRVRVLVGSDGRVEVQSVEIDATPIATDLSFRRRTTALAGATSSEADGLQQPRTVKMRVAQRPVSRDDPFLRWKTTNRQAYARALNDLRTAETLDQVSEAAEDVILFNQFGQITESTIANVAIVRSKPCKAQPDGKEEEQEEQEEEVVTPPVGCGLLAGTMRQALLEGGWMVESPITIEDLKAAREVLLFNSVRGVYRAHLLW